MAEAVPNAEAVKTATSRTEKARLKAEEQQVSVKMVKDAEETAEAARKAEEERRRSPPSPEPRRPATRRRQSRGP